MPRGPFILNTLQGEWREPENLIPLATDPLIEDIIGEEMAQLIYDNWDWDSWGPMIDYGGGVFGVDVSMMIEVPTIGLAEIPDIGMDNANLILDACQSAYDKEPYH